MKKYLLFVLLLLVGCEIAQIETQSLDTITLTTDKDLYHSGEIIHMMVGLNSVSGFNNVSVRFYGIYASRYRLDQTKVVDLYKGTNNITLDYNAPSCYGCSGISPGTYQIQVDVTYQQKMLANTSTNIEIRQ